MSEMGPGMDMGDMGGFESSSLEGMDSGGFESAPMESMDFEGFETSPLESTEIETGLPDQADVELPEVPPDIMEDVEAAPPEFVEAESTDIFPTEEAMADEMSAPVEDVTEESLLDLAPPMENVSPPDFTEEGTLDAFPMEEPPDEDMMPEPLLDEEPVTAETPSDFREMDPLEGVQDLSNTSVEAEETEEPDVSASELPGSSVDDGAEVELNRQEAQFENREKWSETPVDDFGMSSQPPADDAFAPSDDYSSGGTVDTVAPVDDYQADKTVEGGRTTEPDEFNAEQPDESRNAEYGEDTRLQEEAPARDVGQNAVEEEAGDQSTAEVTGYEEQSAAQDSDATQRVDTGTIDLAPVEEDVQAPEEEDAGSPVELKDGEVQVIAEEVDMEHLIPNAIYEQDGYSFETDEYGRPVVAEGVLHFGESDRTPLGTEIGHMGEEGDQGGHLIGARFGGPSDAFNIRPQAGDLNMGDYKRMEDTWAAALEMGNDVQVRIEPQYEGDSIRPWGYEVRYWVDGEETQTFFMNQSMKGK